MYVYDLEYTFLKVNYDKKCKLKKFLGNLVCLKCNLHAIAVTMLFYQDILSSMHSLQKTMILLVHLK